MRCVRHELSAPRFYLIQNQPASPSSLDFSVSPASHSAPSGHLAIPLNLMILFPSRIRELA
jgi:hypothetical protein